VPEGHSVHRIARQFARSFVGSRVAVSSPQGRFAEGAGILDGRVMTDARAVGKQMFLEFDGAIWLRVHLGLYGAWDFAGEIARDATISSAAGRMGQTNQRGTVDAASVGSTGSATAEADSGDEVVHDEAGEDSMGSIGAPRRTRLRMAEEDKAGAEIGAFPPAPIGQVRVRLLTETAVADLRGPTACEVLDAAQVVTAMARLGPDPLLETGSQAKLAEDRFTASILKRATPIGLLLMDQQVVSGIGNVFRAELLFRARLNPHTPGKLVSESAVRELWRDWAHLLTIGVETGQMMTMDDLDALSYRRAMARQRDRHWVYKREGLPCRVCGTNIALEIVGARKLYWCQSCQA
jgi:endonuclease-8